MRQSWEGLDIGTSDAGLVPKVLDCVQRAGVTYAILHGVERVVTQSVVSDLDVLVSGRPEDVIQLTSRCLNGAGLVPIMEWPYDVGHTLTVFLATLDGREAMQLDMLSDRWGLGKYAVRSDDLLRRAEQRDGVTALNPVDEFVYLVRKRIVKGDAAALTILRGRVSSFARGEINESTRSTLSASGRRSVDSFIEGQRRRAGIRPFRSALNLLRQLRRLRRPTGYWIHCVSSDVAEAAVERFGSYLPHAVSIGSAQSPAAITRILIQRMRPGIVVTNGVRPTFLRPDVVVESESVDGAMHRIVEAFRARTEQRLGVA